MRDWLARAQRLTHVGVTERDWLWWGHLTPEEWLYEAVYPDLSEVDAPDDWDAMHGEGWEDAYEDEDFWLDLEDLKPPALPSAGRVAAGRGGGE